MNLISGLSCILDLKLVIGAHCYYIYLELSTYILYKPNYLDIIIIRMMIYKTITKINSENLILTKLIGYNNYNKNKLTI